MSTIPTCFGMRQSCIHVPSVVEVGWLHVLSIRYLLFWLTPLKTHPQIFPLQYSGELFQVEPCQWLYSVFGVRLSRCVLPVYGGGAGNWKGWALPHLPWQHGKLGAHASGKAVHGLRAAPRHAGQRQCDGHFHQGRVHRAAKGKYLDWWDHTREIYLESEELWTLVHCAHLFTFFICVISSALCMSCFELSYISWELFGLIWEVLVNLAINILAFLSISSLNL